MSSFLTLFFSAFPQRRFDYLPCAFESLNSHFPLFYPYVQPSRVTLTLWTADQMRQGHVLAPSMSTLMLFRPIGSFPHLYYNIADRSVIEAFALLPWTSFSVLRTQLEEDILYQQIIQYHILAQANLAQSYSRNYLQHLRYHHPRTQRYYKNQPDNVPSHLPSPF